MIWHDVEQGSSEWHQLRVGIPTASEFNRIVTPKGKLSDQRRGYLDELLAQWLFGCPLEHFESDWMIHGHESEPEAAAAYEFLRGVELTNGGFFTTDDGMVGASPDRLIAPRGSLEIKCVKATTHVSYMRYKGVEEKYRCQVQGQIWVAERDWCDAESYCAGLPTIIRRADRDEEFIGVLSDAVGKFVDELLEAREQIKREYGIEPHQRAQAVRGMTDEEVMADVDKLLGI